VSAWLQKPNVSSEKKKKKIWGLAVPRTFHLSWSITVRFGEAAEESSSIFPASKPLPVPPRPEANYFLARLEHATGRSRSRHESRVVSRFLPLTSRLSLNWGPVRSGSRWIWRARAFAYLVSLLIQSFCSDATLWVSLRWANRDVIAILVFSTRFSLMLVVGAFQLLIYITALWDARDIIIDV
jgi:hypothetical protein